MALDLGQPRSNTKVSTKMDQPLLYPMECLRAVSLNNFKPIFKLKVSQKNRLITKDFLCQQSGNVIVILHD